MAKKINFKAHDSEINELISEMILEEKVSLIHASLKFESGGVERLNIKSLVLSDGPHGIRPELIPDIIAFKQAGKDDDFSVYLPTETALASTWNIDLAYQFGKALALEAKARGKEVLLGPGINIIRTPLNGRNFEYLSEDPFLSKSMAVPYIRGVQDHGIAACAKHFIANNQEWERFTISAEMDERTLHEIYLPAFKAVVEDGQVMTIMGAYNQFRGQFCCHNDYILNKTLKEKLSFDGLVMSDWNGTHDTMEAGNNGLDLEMGTEKDWDEYYMARPLIEAVKNGKVTIKKIDDKVRRVLRVMFFIRKFKDENNQELNIEKHHQLALEIARESIVLLKNENQILPLNLNITKKILVVGENAVKKHAIEGGSSQVKARYEVTPLEGIKNRFAGAEIIYVPGYSENKNADAEALRQEAVEAARNADVVVIVGGLNHTEHDREYFDRLNMKLPYGQDELISAIAEVNPKTIVALVSGGSNDMTTWINKVPAILQIWYNGMEGGNAFAEVLLGKINPSGKLTMTFPKQLSDSPAHKNSKTYPGENGQVFYKEGIFVGYRHYDKYKIKPQFCFGHGLSYTSFKYSNITLSTSKIDEENDTLKITFNIQNIDKRQGIEIAQLYISAQNSQVEKAEKELKGFIKINLAAGQKKEVQINIKHSDFQHFDGTSGQWALEAGKYEICVGSSAECILLKAQVNVQ